MAKKCGSESDGLQSEQATTEHIGAFCPWRNIRGAHKKNQKKAAAAAPRKIPLSRPTRTDNLLPALVSLRSFPQRDATSLARRRLGRDGSSHGTSFSTGIICTFENQFSMRCFTDRTSEAIGRAARSPALHVPLHTAPPSRSAKGGGKGGDVLNLSLISEVMTSNHPLLTNSVHLPPDLIV